MCLIIRAKHLDRPNHRQRGSIFSPGLQCRGGAPELLQKPATTPIFFMPVRHHDEEHGKRQRRRDRDRTRRRSQPRHHPQKIQGEKPTQRRTSVQTNGRKPLGVRLTRSPAQRPHLGCNNHDVNHIPETTNRTIPAFDSLRIGNEDCRHN